MTEEQKGVEKTRKASKIRPVGQATDNHKLSQQFCPDDV